VVGSLVDFNVQPSTEIGDRRLVATRVSAHLRHFDGDEHETEQEAGTAPLEPPKARPYSFCLQPRHGSRKYGSVAVPRGAPARYIGSSALSKVCRFKCTCRSCTGDPGKQRPLGKCKVSAADNSFVSLSGLQHPREKVRGVD